MEALALQTMPFLDLLAGLRTGWANTLFSALTWLGDEITLLAVIIVFLWCVDKRRGFYIATVSFTGMVANQFLKLFCRVPRPWVLREDFQIVEAARGTAGDYSFPSGHTQASVGIFAGIAHWTDKKWLRAVCIALAVIVPFSRMYLGVHTPLDIAAAAVVALALVFALKPVFQRGDPNGIRRVLIAQAVLSALALLLAAVLIRPEEMDPVNLNNSMKSLATLCGASVGLVCSFEADVRWLHYDTRTAAWWGQALKLILGMVIVIALREGGKAVFGKSLVVYGVLHFVLVVFAGIVWPMTFKWFAKLGKK